jgi:putative oxidoreductase
LKVEIVSEVRADPMIVCRLSTSSFRATRAGGEPSVLNRELLRRPLMRHHDVLACDGTATRVVIRLWFRRGVHAAHIGWLLQAVGGLGRLLGMGRLLAETAAREEFVGGPGGWMLTATRYLSAAVFVSFGAGKFLNHASETTSFETYGLPWPGLFAGAIGVLELAGGVLLLTGLLTRFVAFLLAGDMIGAIIVSGLLHGETVSLTLAPILLAAMVPLVLLGPGRFALESRLAGYGHQAHRPDATGE